MEVLVKLWGQTVCFYFTGNGYTIQRRFIICDKNMAVKFKMWWCQLFSTKLGLQVCFLHLIRMLILLWYTTHLINKHYITNYHHNTWIHLCHNLFYFYNPRKFTVYYVPARKSEGLDTEFINKAIIKYD